MPVLAQWVPGLLLGAVIGALCVLAYTRGRLRQLQTSLEQEQQRMRVLSEACPSVLVSIRLAPDGTWSYPLATERLRALFGIAGDQLTQSALARVLSPDDLATIGRSLRESAATLQPWDVAYRVCHPERGQRWLESLALPVRDADGGTTWHGTVTDVTERRRVADDLQASEHLLLQMGEVAAVGGWEADLRTGLRRWTPEVMRILGLPADAPPDVSRAIGLFAPESRARLESALAGAEQGVSFEIDVECVTPDGAHRWVRTLGRPVVEDGTVVRLAGALWDITAARQAESDLQERLALETQLAQLAKSSPGVMYAFRRDADGRSCFPLASPRLEELFAVPLEALTRDAAPAIARIHPEDLSRLHAEMDQSAASMTTCTHDFRVQHPTRGVVWVEGRSAPSPRSDGGVLWHGFFVDVTDRRLLEEQLRQSQKMEAIGQLAGGVAHDFNNLLTVILGNATLLSEPGSALERAEHAQEIARAADRASALTRQLLLFSRREVMRPVNLDLNDVIGNMARLLQRILGEDVRLHATFAPGLPAVHADPGMLEQVLLNLAVNSRDAMPDGGDLFVATSSVPPDPLPSDDRTAGERRGSVCLTVRDSGGGMSTEVQAHIFEPFYTTKAPGKGTGLGLATVYGIVRQHGGSVEVTSAPGAGATFRIVLPAVPGLVAPAPEPLPRVSAPAAGATVLVVEDEPAVRSLTAAVLEQAGYGVVTAATGRLALDAWRASPDPIAAVVTDIVMPDGMTGPELARVLRAEDPELPVIFVSGYSADTASAGLSLEDGVNFLQKPFQLSTLTRVVRRAIERRPRGTPRAS